MNLIDWLQFSEGKTSPRWRMRMLRRGHRSRLKALGMGLPKMPGMGGIKKPKLGTGGFGRAPGLRPL